MKRAICSGSFDPVTNGHIDLFERAGALFDEIIIAILINNKKKPLFPLAERERLLRESIAHIKNATIDSFDGLLVDYAREKEATAIVRGLRSNADFEYEKNIATMNKELAPQLDTLFLMTDPNYSYVSSSIVKEVASYSQDVSKLVPQPVAHALKEVYRR
ncbi:pantetheine-phosphate adenylyltransferase [Shouchella clausii]|jgi:pantetheine-phosphate adenylyltransferase|uniref:Phosphopantetheine adenylyltransferase n=3 Tax=Shouchella TaxID=2893057 RepID=COAD_SHOC1|nr:MULTISPECIES: pantetheine-phosphate adenylyltransferase [Shouchella]Q5WFE8.1 RecName: Full=Phosphopantetheine adenylyltransferase; AltName: Full=Dephospho-CoA pyrophosphorylase; AltName: Full=Pantetheine-phosphate adenylyltransferase; Short=PPAT [Shouchella clausii KSM-K16]MCM3312305.1 pantetheine-phosphate adenylyltransferase [Psychrobacillus sp. MER TA 17]ALA54724.1 Phosphopantetheine adenylyltransferase [Shouchella clausii]KKI84581.1 phosphopantetheine adenylyltransferase [Shouchella clau